MTTTELIEVLGDDVVRGAQSLLGATIVRGDLRAEIVETEAYRSEDDPASHAYRGMTPRNAVMFGKPGYAYVYFNYGVHWMFNVTAHGDGRAAGILIRAAQPLAGLDVMRERRRGLPDRELLSGPGKLAAAFAITGSDTGHFLFDPKDDSFRIEPADEAAPFVAGPRVGIAIGKGHDTPWRFVNARKVEWASRPRPALVK